LRDKIVKVIKCDAYKTSPLNDKKYKNYFDIVDFIDFFLDIRGDDDTLGEGRLKKPYTLKKEDGKNKIIPLIVLL